MVTTTKSMKYPEHEKLKAAQVTVTALSNFYAMIKFIPRGLYDEALETYPSIRPMMLTSRQAAYDVSKSDWQHLLEMARAHLEGQVVGASNEDGHVTRCRRYLKQLAQLTTPTS